MILFVDDERRYVNNYIEELESAGTEVKYIRNIESALELFQSEEGKNIEVLVLDAMMPFDEGFAEEEAKVGMELYNRFREHFPKVPVFILTNVSRGDVREFFENQSDCYFNRKDETYPVEFSQKVGQVLKKR